MIEYLNKSIFFVVLLDFVTCAFGFDKDTELSKSFASPDFSILRFHIIAKKNLLATEK